MRFTNLPLSVHYFPEDKARRKNWTEYDEEAFKNGVARPFVKYIHWMGAFPIIPLSLRVLIKVF